PAGAQSNSPVRTDDPPGASALPTLTIDDARITEGDTGVRSLEFRFHLSMPAADSVSVDVATFDGTATVADQDYEPVSLRLTFPPARVAESLTGSVTGDTKIEADGPFLVRLATPVGAAFSDSEAVGTIVNDDVPLLAVADTAVAEGDV